MIELKNIKLAIGGRNILDGIDAKAAAGELTLLLGDNGTGKTTLFNALCGFRKIDSGEIRYNSVPVSPGTDNFNDKIAFIRDDGGTVPLLSVEEQLTLQCYLNGLPKDEFPARIRDTLEILNLMDYRHYRAEELSAGVRKKLGIALGLIAGSRIFLFDEPFSSLDFKASSRLYKIIEQLKSRGRIIILSTHSPVFLEPLTDRIWMLEDGKITETVSADKISSLTKDGAGGLSGITAVFLPWIKC